MPARAVLMVEPVGFRSNPETAVDNAFQRADGPDPDDGRARAEFDGLRRALEAAGVEVVAFAPPANRDVPDAVFPNNWFSTHPDGTVVLYPMRAPSRRRERSDEIVRYLEARYPVVLDWSGEADRGRFLEGTGSLVIDAAERTVYASASARTSPDLVRRWAERFDHRAIVFESRDREGRPVYHTNVMLAIGGDFALVCADAIVDPADRAAVLGSLERAGRAPIEISLEQMSAFSANALALESADGEPLVAMSTRGRDALNDAQRAAVERSARLVAADLTTIETRGGGGARCMLAELH